MDPLAELLRWAEDLWETHGPSDEDFEDSPFYESLAAILKHLARELDS